MYDGQTALIANYINPIIGDMEVQEITPRVVDKYIQTLQKHLPYPEKIVKHEQSLLPIKRLRKSSNCCAVLSNRLCDGN